MSEREIKKHHLAHHIHSERGNYGITLDWVDRSPARYRPHKPTRGPAQRHTHNLGYDAAERERYPWVAELSASDDAYTVLRTRRTA
jgi:sterol desaturase/sphingolipid hydroxylase (fatty acid hydroxylase superfamily)